MRALYNGIACAAALAALCAAPALAQEAQAGLLTYPASFFAGAQVSTAFDMIGRLPGFTFDGGDSSERGFGGASGNVLIDGQRPTSKTDSLQSVLRRVPAGDVERIDLIRGGAPGIDMQGQTVVANVIRKQANSTSVVATIEDRIFEDGRQVPFTGLDLSRHANGETYEVSLRTTQSFDDSVGIGRHDVFDASGALVSRDVARTHYLGVGVSLKGSATQALLGGSLKGNITLQTDPFVARRNYARPGVDENFIDKGRKKSGELGLKWQGPVGPAQLDALVLERASRVIVTNLADDTFTFIDFRSLKDTTETIARTTLRYQANPSLTLEAGAEGAFNTLEGHTTFALNGVDTPLPAADVQVEEKRGEAFARAAWQISPHFLLEGGARFENSEISETGDVNLSRTFFYTKPRVALTWSPSGDTQIRARYERVVGQLSFSNFIAAGNLATSGVAVGNADLRPDQRAQYEISFERRFWTKGAVVLSALHEDITDVVDRVAIFGSTGVFDAPGNIGDGTSDTINLTFTAPLDRLRVPGGLLVVSGTKRWSQVRDPLTGETRGISGQRPQVLTVNFSQDLPRLKSTWGLIYYGGWEEDYFLPTQVRRTRLAAPYAGVFWDWSPSPSWRVHVQADGVASYVLSEKNEIYSGPRNTAPLSQIDLYKTRSQPILVVQVRKTF